MARLYDRLLAHGCEPLNAEHVMSLAAATADDFPDDVGAAGFLEGRLGRKPTEAEVRAQLTVMRDVWRENVSTAVVDAAVFQNSVVIAAEEVGRFWATLPFGTDTLDIVDRLVPPFDRTFIEFQNCSNKLGVRSWGVLLESEGLDGGQLPNQRWEVQGTLVAEWEKGKPVGPIVRYVIPLDSHGHAYPSDEEGRGSFFVHELTVGTIPVEELRKLADTLISLVGPALFAVSLMHCKNVDVRAVDPPERLSKKHARRHSRPLTRYYVLNIEAMRRVLTSEGQARSKGLRHAMHICRGHFKTYTEGSPLFGRHTGTYWWASQARGNAEEGVVEKDYRIRLDQGGLGRGYAEADEHPEIKATAAEHPGLDPDLGGRGLRAHNIIQNRLAATVRDAGYEPINKPKPDEPQYDLAWNVGDVTWVAEVKSITPQNEERQLRHALSQVLRYAQLLELEQRRTVRTMIATEVKPTDATWIDLCEREHIVLVWGPDNLAVEA